MPDAGHSGEKERFEALVSGWRPALVRAAERILRDHAETEDVVQETLARVWLRLDAVKPGALKAYLFRAVELNALKRRARRRRPLPLDAVGDVAAADSGEGGPHLGPMELERALDGLSATQQAVLRMKFYLGMTFREIGLSLSVSTNTAASRCRYALGRLRKALTSKRSG